MPFSDPITAGDVLIRDAIQSPNYVPGSAGWTINKDGTAEFADTTIRGDFSAGNPPDDYVVIDSTGISVYTNGTLVGQWNYQTGSDVVGVLQAIHVNTDELTIGTSAPVGSGTVVADMVDGNIYGLGHILVAGARDRIRFYDLGTSFNPLELIENGNGNKIPDSRHFQAEDVALAATFSKTGADVSFSDVVTLNFTTLNNNATITVIGTLDATTSATSIGVGIGQLVLDGVAATAQIIIPSVQMRGTWSQSWVLDVPAAGAHTVTLQARKSAAAGTLTISQTHSKFTVNVSDLGI